MTIDSRFPAGLAALLLAGPAWAADEAPGWSYEGDTGPENWGELHAAYAACGAGTMQSPVDLGDSNALGEIDVSVDYRAQPLKVANKGKTVQVDFEPGSYMTTSGRVFSLLQVHFHTPSEHTVDGETFPLVAHFVHANAAGELGVLGILYEAGEPNPELQKIVDAADEAGAEAAIVPGVTLDATGMLPDELEVYRYMGSLTTPPCSEGVNWHVVRETVEASGAQIRAFGRLMGDNARPVLPLNNRLLVAPE
jgi:carbonic anhydrase